MSARLVYEMSRMALGEADGLVIVIKLPTDESGVHDGSPVLTVAAFAARPREWQEWTKRWNVAKRPIRVFRAADAANLHGEFEGWCKEERDKLVIRVLTVINEFNLPGAVIGIHIDAFREAFRAHPDLLKIFGTPYTACFQWLTQAIMNIASQVGSRERLGFIHETNDYQHEALDSFDWVKANANPNRAVIALQFADKADYVPLQAADVLAYEGNKRMRDPDRPERRPWKALNPDGRILAAHYGRENMGELIKRLQLFRDGRINEIDPGSGWKRSAYRRVEQPS